jgi:hypothetical protein
MTVKWAPVAGYVGRYDVSSAGEVRSHYYPRGKRPAPRILRPKIAGRNPGYLAIALCDGEGGIVERKVHHLILETFVGPRPDGMEAAHLNGDARDNRAENLQWVTHTENCRQRMEHGGTPIGERCTHAKLTNAEAAEILARLRSGETAYQIAKTHRISRGAINAMVEGRTWKHVEAAAP